jgi:hypothetical protein
VLLLASWLSPKPAEAELRVLDELRYPHPSEP